MIRLLYVMPVNAAAADFISLRALVESRSIMLAPAASALRRPKSNMVICHETGGPQLSRYNIAARGEIEHG